MQPISQQLQYVISAPIPILLIAATIVAAAWKVLDWHYKGVIETLQHRVDLRDDTISRYEERLNVTDTHPVLPQIELPTFPHPTDLSAANLLDDDRSNKVFISSSVSASDLRSLFANSTTIRANNQARLYIGKWMVASGTVRDVYEHTEGRANVRLLDSESDVIGLRGFWLTFDHDVGFVETLKPEDTLVAAGKIVAITAFDITLDCCEVIKSQ